MVEGYEVSPLPGFDPAIGGWLWALEEARARTVRLVRGVDQRMLDRESPDANENAIGSLPYRIAEVEMGWLWNNIRGLAEMPPDILAEFTLESAYEETGRITTGPGVPLEK